MDVVLPPLLLRQVDLGDAACSALKLLFCRADAGIWNELRCRVRLFELVDVAGAELTSSVAAALTVDVDLETVELQRYSVNPGYPQGLVSGRLLCGVADRLRAGGAKRLLIAAPTDIEEIGELWSAGFRKAPAAGSGWLELSL